VFFVAVVDSQGQQLSTIDVSDILGIDNKNKPLPQFYEPLTTSVFLPDDNLFIQVYHRFEKKQYSFTYSYKENKMLSDVEVHTVSNSTIRNFPIKTFYSAVNKEIYTFYRQG